MHDDLKEEFIVNKVGGRFKLSTLIQKRMVALNTGAKPLVNNHTKDKLAIVRLEVEVRLVGTGFLGTPTATSPFVANGATAAVTASGLTNNSNYHWQARAVDITNRPSAWVSLAYTGIPAARKGAATGSCHAATATVNATTTSSKIRDSKPMSGMPPIRLAWSPSVLLPV